MTEEEKPIEELKPIEPIVPVSEPEDQEDDGFGAEEEVQQYGYKYDAPQTKETFIDTGTGAIVDKKDLSPFQAIKAIAKQNGYEIKNPRSGCKKCYGRGYIGRDNATLMPIPCSCIYPTQTKNQQESVDIMQNKNNPNYNPNHKQKRQMKLFLRKQVKKNRGKFKDLYNDSISATDNDSENLDTSATN